MDSRTECSCSIFADHIKLSNVDMLEGRDVIQRDLDRLDKWSHASFVMLDMVKCKVLHPGLGNPKHNTG